MGPCRLLSGLALILGASRARKPNAMGSRPFARGLKGGLRGGWYRLMFLLGYRLGPLPPLESAGDMGTNS